MAQLLFLLRTGLIHVFVYFVSLVVHTFETNELLTMFVVAFHVLQVKESSYIFIKQQSLIHKKHAPRHTIKLGYLDVVDPACTKHVLLYQSFGTQIFNHILPFLRSLFVVHLS